MIFRMSATDSRVDARTASEQKAAAILMGLSYALGAVGIYFGFASAAGGSTQDFALFVILAVGGPTVAGFIRHFFLWHGDANRLGFEAKDPSWMWEVAFANLAIALGAILTVALSWGVRAQAIIAIVMGVYMLGAAFVHIMSWRSKPPEERRRPFLHIGMPLIYGIVLLYIAFKVAA